MDVDVEVSRLKLMKADHQSKQYRLEDQLLKYFPEEIEKHKGFIKGFESDLEVLAAHPHPEDGFAGMEIRGDLLTDKENAGAAPVSYTHLHSDRENAVIEGNAAVRRAVLGLSLIHISMLKDLVGTYQVIKGTEYLFTPPREVVGKCPRCGGEVAELQKGFFCQNKDCKFAIWKNNKWWAAKKKQPTKAVVSALLNDGRVRVTGLYSEKTSNKFRIEAGTYYIIKRQWLD